MRFGTMTLLHDMTEMTDMTQHDRNASLYAANTLQNGGFPMADFYSKSIPPPPLDRLLELFSRSVLATAPRSAFLRYVQFIFQRE